MSFYPSKEALVTHFFPRSNAFKAVSLLITCVERAIRVSITRKSATTQMRSVEQNIDDEVSSSRYGVNNSREHSVMALCRLWNESMNDDTMWLRLEIFKTFSQIIFFWFWYSPSTDDLLAAGSGLMEINWFLFACKTLLIETKYFWFICHWWARVFLFSKNIFGMVL